MCGIVGIWLKNELATVNEAQLAHAISSIHHRGPNAQNFKIDANVGLAHARLSIVDLSAAANQPMMDKSGRYSLIFNGEIYNYEALKENLPSEILYQTTSDTEVLLNYLIHFGLDRINDLNGFFSFVFYDHQRKKILFARDRLGIKPLLLYEDETKFIFSSELAAMFSFDIDRSLDESALNLLFRLTYIPAPYTILKHTKAVLPGHCGTIEQGELKIFQYYNLKASKPCEIAYEAATLAVKSRVEKAVKRRLLADVPLGAFLSGGVDSSIISLVAKQYKTDLKTFSVGFDSPYFDETIYAEEMAAHIGSNHHQLQLTKADFQKRFQAFLSLNHQPFADSSAFAVYVLSETTKEHVTVCLSGDGADELFGGYRKHEAEFKLRALSAFKKQSIKTTSKVFALLPKGRHSKWSDLNRKFQKFAKGAGLPLISRYWNWLTFIDHTDKVKLLRNSTIEPKLIFEISEDLNSVFQADQTFVLPNDMLTKVDRMSMAHGLEVRTPFLDHELVDYVNSLPASYKVNKNGRKQILIDAFKDELPPSIYSRKKKGFEIPILDWLKDDMADIFNSRIFSEEFINQQGIFNYAYICELRNNFTKPNFGDRIYLVWTLIIFQNWWYRNIWKESSQ